MEHFALEIGVKEAYEWYFIIYHNVNFDTT